MYEKKPKGPRDIQHISLLSASGSLEEYAAAQYLAGSKRRIIAMFVILVVCFGLPFFLWLLRNYF
ncbi:MULTISPECIES: hypothetical protein [Corallincola]|uniref:Uncharacterized protein n=2 Tax=Corallincola TaxID=1775176 RepID=A0A368N7A4_9GAMM|nr:MULTISPECIES: hypothetical protein [Corallincola]RCU45405.1 hypothetical protein DU002_15205 [Corallincola holothuriorum]TAA41085.1 hypothetical protein EXY25_17440 [Corallincola spongiicola]